MADRRRERKGTHSTVAGEAADEVIAGLVEQFSDPYACVRELIQNSLDAGAGRIELHFAYADGTLEIAVRDDGEGMDRETIEGYLLVKFRSAKFDDLTKIGKFGIGFVSLWSMRPAEVVVDTGRDGVWHRVHFDEHLNYTLLRMPDPFEGTTVLLRVKAEVAAAEEMAKKLHESAVKWCRFADAEIASAAEGLPNPWSNRSIRHAFALTDASVSVEVSGDGWRAVLAPHRGVHPPVSFYNRGLLLWEGAADLLPGATFMVEGRHLEHTLTRDNVIRDRHFAVVMARLREAARGPLADAVHAAAGSAAKDVDLPRIRALFATLAPQVSWSWDPRAPLLPALGREPVSLAELRRDVPNVVEQALGRGRRLLFAPAGDALGLRVAAAGQVVLVGDAAADPHLAWVAAMLGTREVDVRDAFWAVDPVEPSERLVALGAAAEALLVAAGRAPGLAFARFAVTPRLAEHLVVYTTDPAGVAEFGAPRVGVRVVAVDHPLVVRLLALPPELAAPLLARGVAIAEGERGPVPDAWVGAALKALE